MKQARSRSSSAARSNFKRAFIAPESGSDELPADTGIRNSDPNHSTVPFPWPVRRPTCPSVPCCVLLTAALLFFFLAFFFKLSSRCCCVFARISLSLRFFSLSCESRLQAQHARICSTMSIDKTHDTTACEHNQTLEHWTTSSRSCLLAALSSSCELAPESQLMHRPSGRCTAFIELQHYRCTAKTSCLPLGRNQSQTSPPSAVFAALQGARARLCRLRSRLLPPHLV